MNFLEMLLMSKKFSFVDGAVALYGQNVLIFPAPSMVEYVRLTGGDPKYARDMYSMAKDAILEQKQDFSKAFNPAEGIDWIVNVVGLYGLGKISYEDPAKAPCGTIFLSNSPFKNSSPTNHTSQRNLNSYIDAKIRYILDTTIHQQ